MDFDTIEEALDYIKKIEDENNNLHELLDNQKAVMSEKENNINSLNNEINRLKIKNYELFEQIPVTGQTKLDSSSKKDESEFDIDYLLKNFD